jgi:hypothetical protein
MDYDVADVVYNNFVHKLVTNEDKKNELLANPMHTDLVLAQLSRTAMPESKAAKLATKANFDKAMLAIPEGDPRRLVFEGLREDMPKILSSKYGVAPETAILNETKRRLENAKEDTYKYIQAQEGIWGKKTAKPEGYDDWALANPTYAGVPIAARKGATFGVLSQLASMPIVEQASRLALRGSKLAKPMMMAGRFLSMNPFTKKSPILALGGAALLGAGAFAGEEAVATAAAKAGHPLSTLERIAVGLPMWVGTGKLARMGESAVEREGTRLASQLGSTAEYNGVKATNEFVRGKSGNLAPKPPVTREDLKAADDAMNLSKADKVAQAAKMEGLKKLRPEDIEAITLNPENEAAIRKAAFERNVAEDATATVEREMKVKQDIVDRAAGLRATNPGMTTEESIELARRKVNPNAIEVQDDLKYLRDTVGYSPDTLATMSPSERAIKRALWEQHSNYAGTKAIAIRDEILPPAIAQTKKTLLTNPKINRVDDGSVIYGGSENWKVGKGLPATGSAPLTKTIQQASSEKNQEVITRIKQRIESRANAIIPEITMSQKEQAGVITHNLKTQALAKDQAKLVAETEEIGKNILEGAKTVDEKINNLNRLATQSYDRATEILNKYNMAGNTNASTILRNSLTKVQDSLKSMIPAKELKTRNAKVVEDELEQMISGMGSTGSPKGRKLSTVSAESVDKQKKAEWYSIFGHKEKISPEEFKAKEDKVQAWIDKWSKPIGVAGAAGLVTLGSLFPSDAEAAPLGNPATLVPGGLKDLIVNSGKAVNEVVQKLVEGGFGPPKISGDGHAMDWIMRSMSFAPKNANIFPRTKVNFFDKISSPHMRDDIHMDARYADGTRAPFSMAKEVGYRSQVILANTDASLKVVNNILKDAGIEQQLDDVSALFKPLVDKYHKQVNLENPFWHGEVEAMDKVLTGKFNSESDTSLKRLSKFIKISKGDLSGLDPEDRVMYEEVLKRKQNALAKIEELKPILEEFDNEYAQYAKTAAERFPTARVALAVDGYGMKEGDAWLASMLTPAEKKAAEEISALNTAYAVRMKETGHQIIEGSYMHHPSHPEVDYTSDLQHLGNFTTDSEEAMRLVNFFHRSAGSKLMIPDTHYVMGRYLPDVNKRIEISDMWKMGEEGGWDAIRKQMQARGGHDGALKLIDDVRTAFDPLDTSNSAKWLNRYAAFEVARLLTLSPSVSFKHALKLMGNWTIFPADISLKASAENFGLQARQLAQDISGEAYRGKDNVADLSRALTSMHHTYAAVSDMAPYELPVSVFDKYLQRWNKAGSAAVNGVERFDRGQTFISSMMMAQKKGMTPDQALYGLMDSVLRVNFLTGANNPKWLKDPLIRTMMMFQGTPFKILEQRAMTAYQGGKEIVNTLKLLKQLKNDVKKGEENFKWHLLNDELTRHKDVFGNNYSTQLLKQMMVLGTVIYGGKKVFDADMWGHAIHIPGMQLSDKGIQLGVNPLISAGYQTLTGGNVTPENEEDFALSRFFQSWLGKSGFPAIAHKVARLRDDDIPAMYKDSKLSYLFGVPKVQDED